MKQLKQLSSFILLGGLSLLVLLALVNAGITFGLDSKLDRKISQIKEAGRPAVIQLTVIQPECDGCTDASPFVEKVKQSNVNITSEKTIATDDAAQLIASYRIKRLPAIILEGEIDRISAPSFEAKEHGLVYDSIAPPYYDTATGTVEGKVHAQMIEAPSCDKCPDMQEIVRILGSQGVFFASNAELKADASEAQKLIREHGIAKLPALLFSEDVSAYPEVLDVMAQGGFRQSGSQYVYESQLPYYNLSSKKVQGLVDLIMLKDGSCTPCYDVSIHKQILLNIGMATGTEKTVDVSSPEGKQLLQQYSIAFVPAIVLKGDAMMYPGFGQIWGNVGTIEKDGSFVFRNNNALGPGFSYKNLATGEVVTVPNPSGARSG